MEIIALFGAWMPLILAISLFFSVLTKLLMRISLKAANALLIISIFALIITAVDFLIYVLDRSDRYDLLGDGGRGFMFFFLSPALAIISINQWKPWSGFWGGIRTFAYTISTIILCIFSILFMWFYWLVAAGY